MVITSLNGTIFEEMLKNALNNLKVNEKVINSMNVFPVPDGDTGSNMRVTLENGVVNTKPNNHLGDYLKDLSRNMLIGARGNSGVILSQFFKGIYEELKRCSIANSGELRDAFINAYKMAYKAVSKPTEGTILTVAREGIENIKDQVSRSTKIDVFFSIYVAEMKKSLSYTPELLPILKEAGVIDSGGAGYVVLVEGLLMYLHDEIVDLDNAKEEDFIITTDIDNFNADSKFELGYEISFHLQLLNGKGDVTNFDLDKFNDDLEKNARDIVSSREGDVVISEVKTMEPSKVIELCQKYGEFITFDMDNLDIKSNKETTKKFLGKVAVVSGDGLKEIYHDLGCDIVIDGGKTMNAYSSDFIRALRELNALNIVILPNDKNNILAINQAVDFLSKKNVSILKTNNVLEGYYALASDVNDSDNLDYRINQMEEGKNMIETFGVFASVRDCTLNDVRIKKDDYVIVKGDIVLDSYSDLIKTIVKGLEKLEAIDEKSTLIISKGKDYEFDDDELLNGISDAFPNLEVSFIEGGQPVYSMLIGLL